MNAAAYLHLLQIDINPSNFNLGRLRERFLDFGLVFDNFGPILEAVLVTISLAFFAEVLGIVLGLVLALMKISRSRLLRFPAQLYIDVFRGRRCSSRSSSCSSRSRSWASASRACSSRGWPRSP
ncbi:hypothetical protein [Rubrobacter marinus]|uniref:hypothetical protein n=1 Tax=Rubrobacter marinus TaxID=2653852 RepID=UPI001A9D997C|nr:hypothetical protein [Rubrobacter marinus]